MYAGAEAHPEALLYVGKAASLRDRVGSYFQKGKLAPKVAALVKLIRHIEVTVTESETEALLLECNLIKEHRPRFNVVLRDDKSFPFIQLLPHKFPRLAMFRGTRNPRGRYFGPYPDARAARASLHQLQKLFRLRNCRDGYFANRSRPCLQYQIGRCTAPCVGLIDAEAYARDVNAAVMVLEGGDSEVTRALEQQMQQASDALDFERAVQLRDQLVALRKVQAEQTVSAEKARDADAIAIVGEPGDYTISLLLVRGGHSLGTTSYFPRSPGEPEEVLASFLLQHYTREEPPAEIFVDRLLPDGAAVEAALASQQARRQTITRPERGIAVRWVAAAIDNATQAMNMRHARRADASALLAALGEALELSEPPRRVECFDISHTAGEGTVASCVVFTSEGPARKEYRRYNIEGAVAGDDYGALREAVGRRYARIAAGEYPPPDVLLIDGGAGQLAAVLPTLAELGFAALPVLGVSKGADRKPGQERLHRPGSDVPLVLPADSPALRVIQRVRDEAHRFAIQGHRKRRARRHQESILETVPGLGPAKRRNLLRHFGGLQGVLRAGVADLSQAQGIGTILARVIYDHLHPGA